MKVTATKPPPRPRRGFFMPKSREKDMTQVQEHRRRQAHHDDDYMAEHVARVVAELPPLTDQQCQRIAGLLLAGGGTSDA
jgi:hypothetical protein